MINYIFGYAIWMIERKYPMEYYNPRYKGIVLDLADMIVEELYDKNRTLFYVDYVNSLPKWNDNILWNKLVEAAKENVNGNSDETVWKKNSWKYWN